MCDHVARVEVFDVILNRVAVSTGVLYCGSEMNSCWPLCLQMCA